MNNKKQVIICVGISGSGKSTWSTKYIEENKNWVRINRDDIRRVIVGDLTDYYQREDLNHLENLVNQFESSFRLKYLEYDKNIIIDNTHLKISYITPLIQLFEKDHYYEVKFKLFPSSAITAKTRVFKRDMPENPEESLKYIDKQYEQYQSIVKWLELNHLEKIIE